MVVAMVKNYFSPLPDFSIWVKAENMGYLVNFTSAYRKLQPSERAFVDGFVANLESLAVRTGSKLDVLLREPVEVDERSADFLARDLVQAAITERVKEIKEDAELSVYKTLKEVRCIGYSNISNYMEVGDDDHLTFDFSKSTPEQMAAVKSFKVKQRMTQMGPIQEIELVMHDKLSALDKLMKYQGLLDDDHWRDENAKAVKAQTLTADTSDDDAADLYAKMING